MTDAQLAALKAAIAAETDPTFTSYRTNGQTTLMAAWLNQPHATVKAWDAAADWQSIANAINFAQYTPSAAQTPTDTAGLCKLLTILVKLNVQQNMLLAHRDALNARDTGNIDALLDSVTDIQSGNNGALRHPGGASGVNVANQLVRAAKRGEVVFGGGDVTKGTVTAKMLAYEGDIADTDISAALAL